MTIAPPAFKPWRRATSAAADASSRPVNGSSSSTRPGWWISARSRATRWRIPRENVDTGSSARSARPARSSAARGGAAAVGDVVQAGKEGQVLARGQFGIEEEIVPEDADARPQRRVPTRRIVDRRPSAPSRCARTTGAAASPASPASSTCRRRWGRAGRRISPRRDLETDVRDRPTAAEVSRDVVDDHAGRSAAGHAAHARPAAASPCGPATPASSSSP